MSRLDDELKRAFRREEPSPDFAERVMKAVAAAPAPKRRWWDELLAMLTPPRGGRWVAVGAAVSLLAVILATQYSRIEQAPPKDANATGTSQPAATPKPDDGNKPEVAQGSNKQESGVKPEKVVSTQRRRHRVISDSQVAASRAEQGAKSEGEAAKDQIMRALHIASASLNEAQRIVREAEGQQHHTEAR